MMTRKMLFLTSFSLLAPALAVNTPAAPTSIDTNAEKAAWEALMSAEGEYAALAAYSAVLEKYGQVEPYVSILRAEQNHAQALARQLQRYGVSVPANPYLGQIPAPTSLKAAAQAWAAGEVKNVALYDQLMGMANGDATLTRVLTNLQSASRDRHLPLFTKAAAGNGTLTAAEMTTLPNQNVNSQDMNYRGNSQGQQLGRHQNQSGQNAQMAQQNAQGNRGYDMTQGVSMGRGQMRQGHMNHTNCPMTQGQGQRQGHEPGWRR